MDKTNQIKEGIEKDIAYFKKRIEELKKEKEQNNHRIEGFKGQLSYAEDILIRIRSLMI